MLSLPHEGAIDLGGARQTVTEVYEGDDAQGEVNWESLSSMSSLPLETKSRARVSCTWKGCNYRGVDTNDTISHAALTHRVCPKEDCNWANAKGQSDKDRHVWSNHKAWAQKTGYPSQSAVCDQCHQTFSRKDRLPRHQREVHGAQKRVRRSGN
ncbi:hypothetical protein BKA63DRAFT_511348 [Paraphoma chrysanthemicola]|nr:hypothetical protein BKA63DRAFT_511348 [Paraphoma chrysanthemicola]